MRQTEILKVLEDLDKLVALGSLKFGRRLVDQVGHVNYLGFETQDKIKGDK